MNYLRYVALASAVACIGCSGDRSPFPLWDMRAGMPMQKLDSIALHDQHERYTCMKSYGTFQECYISSKGASGRVVAIVDSTEHAISVAYYPDINAMQSSTAMGAGLIIETENLRRRWGLVQPATVDVSTPPTKIERWTSKDRRWTSRIVWHGSSYPSELSVSDETGMRSYRSLQSLAQADSVARAAMQDPLILTMGRQAQSDLRLVREELIRLATVQDMYHARHKQYAPTLANLHFMPKINIDVTLRSGGPNGWWAVGKHEQIAGHQCVIWLGASPQPPHPSELRLGGEPRTPECGGATR